MTRRQMLSLLGPAAAGLALDPDRLLWEPGKTVTFDLCTPAPLVTFDLWPAPLDMRPKYVITLDNMWEAHERVRRDMLRMERSL